ncbi:MAG: V-type ATP synthase subunit I [Candidatus Endonucleobacter bathymodioli]|uniref:V-type ATP synthase subunit I n=1 Tax=Candidatus Endonucleibacter bathymodioli TaxID=539814 RepID=A0AA90P2V2_9GAMM|nr:V-type ATP synthase subunit I [Candidatus Endonucleobacter bathymodioli]
MAIKRLKKITLYGLNQDKIKILKGLQSLGCLHLISLLDKSLDQSLQVQPAEASEAKAWLKRSPKQRRHIRNFRGLRDSTNIDNIVQIILTNKAQLRSESDLLDKLEQRIRDVRPWGQFSFPEMMTLNGVLLWFYVIPHEKISALNAIKLPWELIHQNLKDSFVIVMSDQEPDEDLLPVTRSHIGKDSLIHLEEMLEEAKLAIEDLLAERESLTRWSYLLNQALAARVDNTSLAQASSGILDKESFFLVQGWMPVSEQAKVETFTLNNGIAVIFEEPTREDNPPTLIEKTSGTGGGSDALGFFQTPKYRSWDPGKVVFYSLSLFFAMIMSDAMYSLIFGLIVLMFRSKLRQSETGSRLINLAYCMSAAGIIWGVCIGSYFGASPISASLLGSITFINLNDYNAMMKLSVIIGVSHLIIANVMTSVVNRGSSYAFVHLGWAGLMVGGLTLWLSITNTLPKTFETVIGPSLMIIGTLLVFLFTSNRPVHSVKDLILRILDGLKAVYNITGAFGDILSYMRLFALGLSGASLSMTFNSLAMTVIHSSPIIGVLFAGMILLLGHTLNFALCIMSGVVHGMRLNVIEFVNWGLSDEGYPFNAFCKREDKKWKV